MEPAGLSLGVILYSHEKNQLMASEGAFLGGRTGQQWESDAVFTNGHCIREGNHTL